MNSLTRTAFNSPLAPKGADQHERVHRIDRAQFPIARRGRHQPESLRSIGAGASRLIAPTTNAGSPSPAARGAAETSSANPSNRMIIAAKGQGGLSRRGKEREMEAVDQDLGDVQKTSGNGWGRWNPRLTTKAPTPCDQD